jgi:two-component system response regulator WspF
MRIAIVNDVPLAREALRRAVASVPDFEVAWLAADGEEAIQKTAADRPDLILMDLIMPRVDGVEATRRIMAETPCPILVVTATVSGNMGRVYEAMGLGALDAVDTPSFDPREGTLGTSPLLEKIRTISKLIGRPSRVPIATPATPAFDEGRPHFPLIAIGASTGGPAALAKILHKLPDVEEAAVVIVQHVDEAFSRGLAEHLTKETGREVELIKPGASPQPGRVYLAGTNDHVILDDRLRFRYVSEPATLYYRPSVDVFFASIAGRWPVRGSAALLTGMGRDGAMGLKSLREAGWATIAQDEATCIVYGMPRAAAEIGAAEQILPLGQIARALADGMTSRNLGARGASPR